MQNRQCMGPDVTNNGYVKMTENESTYTVFYLKFNKFSRKNSLLKKCL